jgi:hypothetical protein
MKRDAAPPSFAATLAWLGAACIVLPALARLLTAGSRLAWWDLDPLVQFIPETTRSPGVGLALDAVVYVGVILVLGAAWMARQTIHWRSGVLALIGAAACALHGWWLTPLVSAGASPAPRGDAANLALGSAWSAAVMGAWGLWLVCSDASRKRAIAAVLIGAALMLAARGLYQVRVEHARTVAMFRENPAQTLASQGLEPGSQAAALFERRLLQAEATGWLGLSNAYGTVVGAAGIALAVLSIGAWRAAARRDAPPHARGETALTSGEAGLIVLATLAVFAGLVMSGSKGAFAATALGAGVALAAWAITRGPISRLRAGLAISRSRIALPAAFVLLCIGAPLLALALRGVIGERLAELSLYFRWQYLTGAVRIATEHPMGVGPAAFKDAYLLAKLPTSPEEVESPHSLFFDWAATLGVLSAAWIALVLGWVWRVGASLRESSATAPTIAPATADKPGHGAPRAARRLVFIVPIVAAAASIATEWPGLGLDLVLVLALAAGVWCLVARVLLRAGDAIDPWWTIALIAAGAVLTSHAMIEVTPVLSGSAAWFFALLATAAAARPARGIAATAIVPARSRAPHMLIVVACAVLLVLASAAAVRTLGAERALRDAARLAASTVDPSSGLVRADRVSDLARARDLLLAQRDVLGRAVDEPVLSVSWRIALAAPSPDVAAPQLVQAIDLARTFTQSSPRSATSWGRLGALLDAASAPPVSVASPADAAAAWEAAAKLDPHGLTPALRAAMAFDRAGTPEAAAAWARRALDIDQNLRLDPLKRLTDVQRREVDRIARGERGQDAAAAPTNAPAAGTPEGP